MAQCRLVASALSCQLTLFFGHGPIENYGFGRHGERLLVRNYRIKYHLTTQQCWAFKVARFKAATIRPTCHLNDRINT